MKFGDDATENASLDFVTGEETVTSFCYDGDAGVMMVVPLSDGSDDETYDECTGSNSWCDTAA